MPATTAWSKAVLGACSRGTNSPVFTSMRHAGSSGNKGIIPRASTRWAMNLTWIHGTLGSSSNHPKACTARACTSGAGAPSSKLHASTSAKKKATADRAGSRRSCSCLSARRHSLAFHRPCPFRGFKSLTSSDAMGCQRAFCLDALGTQSGMHPCAPVNNRTTRLRSPNATPPTTTAWRSDVSEVWAEDMGSKVQVGPGQHPCKSAVIFTAQP